MHLTWRLLIVVGDDDDEVLKVQFVLLFSAHMICL